MKQVSYELLPGLELEVFEDGTVMSKDSTWRHPSGKCVCIKKGRKLGFSNNGRGYFIANISVRSYKNNLQNFMNGKFYDAKTVSVTNHRVVYCAFNNLNYRDDFTVGHFDDDGSNNKLNNLYGIFGDGQSQKNRDHKKLAYKLLELYKRGEIQVDSLLS